MKLSKNENPYNDVVESSVNINDFNEDQLEKEFIGSIEDCHEYHADNEFILKGYRIHFLTYKRIFKSLILCHNETFNIWSHLSGCLAVVFLLIFSLLKLNKLKKLTRLENQTEEELVQWPLVLFFLGGFICLLFSASFHLFMAHDKIVKQVFNRLDYSGICLLITGSCYPPYYYYFYCYSSKYF